METLYLCHVSYWPLIGWEWSRDLDTGLWLAESISVTSPRREKCLHSALSELEDWLTECVLIGREWSRDLETWILASDWLMTEWVCSVFQQSGAMFRSRIGSRSGFFSLILILNIFIRSRTGARAASRRRKCIFCGLHSAKLTIPCCIWQLNP